MNDTNCNIDITIKKVDVMTDYYDFIVPPGMENRKT